MEECPEKEDDKHEEEMMIFPLQLEDVACRRDSSVERERVRKTELRFNAPVVAKWRSASRRLLSSRDPWSDFRIGELYPVEECVRHRYSAYRQQWITDRVMVKMETEPFGRGAMRQCFRLKKRSAASVGRESPNSSSYCWSKALNYVAKNYLDDQVDRQSYFADVQLQADAKLWSEEFNRHNPPKKIDIMQVAILEFVNRPGKPLYHLEHFIEGDYIKYNSNSGFVSDQARRTPQAFSHFTFERSGHQLIVVDIQGVGDLYTDPQIHSADGKNCYGDGDLGTKGMALFFYSHVCNSICESLNLTPFDLSEIELKAQKDKSIKLPLTIQTVCRDGAVEMCMSPPHGARMTDFLRQRSLSRSDTIDEYVLPTTLEEMQVLENEETQESWSISSASPTSSIRSRRNRFSSESGELGSSSCSMLDLETEQQWREKMDKLHRPSCVPGDLSQLKNWRSTRAPSPPKDDSVLVLGVVHLDMVRYYANGRFSENKSDNEGSVCQMIIDEPEYDKQSAWFHLDMASRCGVMEAITTCAKIYLGLPHDLLCDLCKTDLLKFCDTDEDNCVDHGLDLMEEAASMGDRAAMLYMGERYELGDNLGSCREKSFAGAINWYENAVATMDFDERMEGNAIKKSGEFDALADYPLYQILAKMAELFKKGGFGLTADPMKAGHLYADAAQAATEAMKGKLASKFFMLSEEAWAEVVEE